MKYFKILFVFLLLVLINFQLYLNQVQGYGYESNDSVESLDKSQIATINKSGYNIDPSFILIENGFILAFASNNEDNYDIYVTNSIDGKNWSIPVQVSNSSNNEYNPSIIEFNDEFFLAYYTQDDWYDDLNASIYLSRSSDGVNWSEPESIINLLDMEQITDFIFKVIDERVFLVYSISDWKGFYHYFSRLYLIESYNGKTWSEPIEIHTIDHDLWGMGNMDSYINSFDIIQRNNGIYSLCYSTRKGCLIESINISNWSKEFVYAYNYFFHNGTKYITVDYQFATNPTIIEIENNELIIINNDGIWKSRDNNNWSKISNYVFQDASVLIDTYGTFWVANVTYQYWKRTSDIHFYKIPKPQAKINSIYPENGNVSEVIHFEGDGEDMICGISSYNWRSSIDGFLSSLNSFNFSNLSEGEHTIYFKVQNDLGLWSDEVNYSITVSPIKKPEPDFISKYQIFFIIVLIIILFLVLLNYIRYKKNKNKT